MSESDSKRSDQPIGDRLKQAMGPDSLIGKSSRSVQRTNENVSERSLHQRPDPAVYDAERNVIGYVEAKENGSFEAKLTDVAIGGEFTTREEGMDKVWQAYLRRNPNAVRPS
jgi:hypothetical protein